MDVKELPNKLKPMLFSLKKYIGFVFFIVILLVYALIIYRMNTFASQQPDEDAITERLTTVQRPRIDEEAIEKIQQLEDQNIQVQTLFEQARDNPFSE